jgi:hypothetical protein
MKKIHHLLAGIAVLSLFLSPVQSTNSSNRNGLSALALTPFPLAEENNPQPVENNVAGPGYDDEPDCTSAIVEEDIPIEIEYVNEPGAKMPEAEVPLKLVTSQVTLKKTAAITKPEAARIYETTDLKQIHSSVHSSQSVAEVEETEMEGEEYSEPGSIAVTESAPAVNPVSNHEAVATVSQEKVVVNTDNKFTNPFNFRTESGTESYSYFSLFERAEQLKKYAAKNGFNIRYAFLADMGMKSGKKRFFLLDLQSFQILKSGLVAHGKGSEEFATEKKYSNEIGSKCTSLGLYKIGKSFNGEFGTAFKLYGLSPSNNNAYKRAIVLHSLNGIPDDEIGLPITQTEGCPSLSPNFLKAVRPLIENNSKPVLLWLFDSTTEQVASLK